MISQPQLRNRATPDILPAKNCAGVCLHIPSLPGQYGIGELGDAAFAFVDTMKAMGQTVWQFLPLGPTAFGDSPYQPLSSFAGNELLIDIGELQRHALLTPAETEPLTRLPQDHVDYGALIPIKTRLLQQAAARFQTRADANLKRAFDEFCQTHDTAWLRDYALFRVLKTRHNEVAWPAWPAAFARRDPAALRAVEEESAAALEAVRVSQFLFHHQCRRLKNYAADNGIWLFGDVPIYIALDSADAWARSEILLIDEHARPRHVAGVPPDYYSADGQLWGNPLYDWAYHERTGYRWWIERFRHTMSYTDLLRIDHFRGFESYWAVPLSARTAREGTWEPGPGHAIFNALRGAIGDLPIVAEDLGVITDAVEALRHEHGIPGMVVLQFDASKPGFSLADIDEHCVCYTGTHDNDTSVGWFHGGPGDTRTKQAIREDQRIVLANTGGRSGTIHLDLIRLAYASRARIAIVPMQDYLGLGSVARLNTPGTRHNNWRWRLQSAQVTPAQTEMIAGMVAAAGRDGQ